MTRIKTKGATLIVSGNQLRSRCVDSLRELIDEVVDVAEMAETASAAPRHATDTAQRADRDHDKIIRRRWFGKMRGTVRHTFRDIRRFLMDPSKNLTLVVGGEKCTTGAWAYTPDDQNLSVMPQIVLCERFFQGSAKTQIATLLHELTHLIRSTIDFDRPEEPEEIGAYGEFNVAAEQAKNKNYFQQGVGDGKAHIAPIEAAQSAYNFQHFVEDLIEDQYDGGGLPDPCRK